MGKKLVLVIIALVVVVGGGIFFIHNGFGNSKTLTRDEAASMILSSLKTSPDKFTVSDNNYTGLPIVSGQYYVPASSAFYDKADALQTAGLITNIKHICCDFKSFTVTDAAKPYLL